MLLPRVTFPFRQEAVRHLNVCDVAKNSQNIRRHADVNVDACSAPELGGEDAQLQVPVPRSPREGAPCSCHGLCVSHPSWEVHEGWRRCSELALSPQSSREGGSWNGSGVTSALGGCWKSHPVPDRGASPWEGSPFCRRRAVGTRARPMFSARSKTPCPCSVALPYPCPSLKTAAAFCRPQRALPEAGNRRWEALSHGQLGPPL